MYIIMDEKNGIVVKRCEQLTEEDWALAVKYHIGTGNDTSVYEHKESVGPDDVKRDAQRKADEALLAQAKQQALIQKHADEVAAKKRIEEEAARREEERLAKERAKAQPAK